MLFNWIKHRRREAPDASIAQAQDRRRQGEYEAARQLCLDLLRDEPDHVGALAMLIGISADLREFDAGLQWAQRALAVDPQSVAAYYALGQLWEVADQHAQSAACYRRVTELAPGHAKAYTNLGCMLHLQGRLDEALACYRQALQLEPEQPEALRNAALITGSGDDVAVAMRGYQERIVANPKDAAAHYSLANVYLELGRHEDAMASYDRAIALEPDSAEYRFARAHLLLTLGDYVRGWQEYEWRWRLSRFNAPLTRFTQPRWDGRPLQDGTLLVHGETGFGDMLQFVRYAALAARRCASVIVECQPALESLIRRVEGVSQVVVQGEALPPFDAHVPLICFPQVFGTTLATIPSRQPYVKAEPARIEAWRALVAPHASGGPKVGLVWSGNPANVMDRKRSVTLQQLAPLAGASAVTFYSLQKGPGASQVGSPPAGMNLVDLTARIDDFSDTAAFLSQLDLLISIDTSVAHLAGAMGLPVWVVLPFAPGWRYHVGRTDNPWYPTMRLFRQERDGDWGGLVQVVADELIRWTAVAR